MRTPSNSSWTAILLLAMICSGRPTVAWADGAANPITNGGFETVNDDGTSADWEFVGTRVGVTDQAHTGRRALRFERPADAKGETGLNRAWKPDSGEQGKMLGQGSLKGGIRFWYKAIRGADCQMHVLLVPMSARPMEDTGESRTIFTVPADHIGDGQWHEGLLKFDYSKAGKVKWLHVGVRLLGGPGEMLFDDVRYVEKIGTALSVRNVRIELGPATQADGCTLSATIANVGDAPLPDAAVSLKLPAGLHADKGAHITPGLSPDGEQTVSWRLTGRRQAGSTIEVLAATKGSASPVTRRLTLDAAPKLRWLLADRFLLAPGERTQLRCVIDNPGTAAAGGLTCKLTATGSSSIKGEPTVVIPPVPSGGSREMTWELIAGQQAGEIHVEAIVTGPKGFRAAASALLEVTPAANAPAQPLVGPICIRKSDGRVLAELRSGDGESTLAWMPYLAKVVYQNGAGKPAVVLARADDIARKDDSAVVTSRVKDADGGTWSFRIGVAPAGEVAGKLTRFESQVECDQPRKLLAFDGPMLYVNGPPKTDAIFPGLEWLQGDEHSSSSLDFKESHPHRVRYVPHPRKLTVPCMGVHNARGTIGLLWDVHQRWNGVNDQPQPVFASPDRFEGRAGTLMGLMAPCVGAGLPENARLATEPVSLAAGTPLRLAAFVYCDADAKDSASLAVVDAWLRQFGAPSPEPIPQGDYVRQLEFSMRAYTDSLWLADEKAWLPYLGGPGIWRKPTHSPGFCHELLLAARITKDAGLAVKYRQLADEQLKLARAKPVSDDFGFGAAHPVASLLDHASQASGLIDEQGPDGQWRFDARRKDSGVFKGMDYHRLGPDNAAELGTSARKAYEVLRIARLTNDDDAYQAGVLALAAMSKFTVPRAAQVWEVPVHTPDILAAADAIDAYIEAYRFSRDPQWLAEARRWARAGLPFVYTWHVPEHPWMLYGSIPVFGATWFEGSWIGRPVQWNGLRYGYALLNLAELDPGDQGGYTWRTIATGLTHSAMHQQSASGKNLALWPDSLDTISGERANWEFAPSQILKNVFCLIGRGNQVEPQTALLAQGESHSGGPALPASRFKKGVRRIAIDSSGEIVAATWKDSRVEFKLNYPPGEQGYSLVVGTAKPTKVAIDGRELPERANLEQAAQPESGWRYDENYAIVVVRVSHDGPATIAIDGVKPLLRSMMLRKVGDIRFEFDRDAEGWVAANDLGGLQAVDGKLVAEIRGRDPYMVRRRCEIDGNAVRTIRVRMLLTGDAAAQSGEFYWASQASPQTDEQKVVRFPIKADGQWHEYAIEVGSHPLWRGQKITQLRIDPGNGATTGRAQIDWMRGEP